MDRRQKQADEGCLRGTRGKSVSTVHSEKSQVPLSRGHDKGVPGVENSSDHSTDLGT